MESKVVRLRKGGMSEGAWLAAAVAVAPRLQRQPLRRSEQSHLLCFVAIGCSSRRLDERCGGAAAPFAAGGVPRSAWHSVTLIGAIGAATKRNDAVHWRNGEKWA